MRQDTEDAGEALLELDHAAHQAVKPVRHHPAVKVLGAVSDIGDQWPLRLLSGGVLLAGVIRRDQRMVRAGARMLLAHEMATLTKNAIKQRIDRSRPRSARNEGDRTPKPGNNTDKEETSFPSGHSAGAMAVASAMAGEYPALRGPALGAGALVAAAQIPRCAHYPTDVGAGMVIGVLAGKLSGVVMNGVVQVLALLPITGHSRDGRAEDLLADHVES